MNGFCSFSVSDYVHDSGFVFDRNVCVHGISRMCCVTANEIGFGI